MSVNARENPKSETRNPNEEVRPGVFPRLSCKLLRLQGVTEAGGLEETEDGNFEMENRRCIVGFISL